MSITFSVPGTPVGWKRARRKGKRYFTDPIMASYQQAVQWSAKQAGATVLEGPVIVLIQVYLPIPKSFSQKRRMEALNRVTRPMPKGDIDNIAKQVMDALNGIAYGDDRQVTDLAISRFYAQEPSISVIVGPA